MRDSQLRIFQMSSGVNMVVSRLLAVHVHNGSRADIVFALFPWSTLQNRVEVFKLTQNMRLVDDPDSQGFSSWLLEIGHGRGCSNDGSETVPLPQQMIIPDLSAFVANIYPSIGPSPPPPPEYFLKWVI